MILVMNGGEVSQQMLELKESIPQNRLSLAAERLNKLMEGATASDVEIKIETIDWLLEKEVGRLVLEAIDRSDNRIISNVHRAGITNLIDDDGTRSAVHLIEERSRLARMINTMFDENSAGVQVVIGGDGRWEELKNCAIIMSRYGMGTDLMGEVAIVGPTRMPYGRNISAVRYVAGLMTEFISDYYADHSFLSGTTELN